MLSERTQSNLPGQGPIQTAVVLKDHKALLGTGIACLGLVVIVWAFFIQQIPDYHFKPGEEADTPYLTGTSDPQKNDNYTYRLTQPDWTLAIPGLNPQSYEMRLTLSSHQAEPVQVIDDNGVVLATFTPTGKLEEYRINIPADSIMLYRLYLHFKSPFDSTNNSTETGLFLNKIDLEPENFFLLPPLPVIYNVLGVTLGALIFVAGYYLGVTVHGNFAA